MKIHYFAMLREAAGKMEEEWDRPAATLGILLKDLSERYGASFQKWIMEKGEMTSLTIILINGHDARHLGRMEAPLSEGDDISIFPPLAGG
jgi:molybdopterin synthase sulfur carrier subunit